MTTSHDAGPAKHYCCLDYEVLDTNFKVYTQPTVATMKLPCVDPCIARHSRRCRRAGGGHARSLVLDEALWTTHTRAGVWGVMQVRQVSYPPHEPHAAGERERVLLEEPNKRRAAVLGFALRGS